MFIFLLLSIVFLFLWIKEKKRSKSTLDEKEVLTGQLEASKKAKDDLAAKLFDERNRAEALSKYQGIVDVEKEITSLRAAVNSEIETTKAEAQSELTAAQEEAKEVRAKARAASVAAESEIAGKIYAADA